VVLAVGGVGEVMHGRSVSQGRRGGDERKACFGGRDGG
jgi:hypothetical protein